MVPRKNKNNSYAKFWRTNKEYYGIFESGLLGGVICIGNRMGPSKIKD